MTLGGVTVPSWGVFQNSCCGTLTGDGVTFFDDVKERSGPCFDARQLGVRLNFDVDVKILLNFDVDGTNVKTAERSIASSASFRDR